MLELESPKIGPWHDRSKRLHSLITKPGELHTALNFNSLNNYNDYIIFIQVPTGPWHLYLRHPRIFQILFTPESPNKEKY